MWFLYIGITGVQRVSEGSGSIFGALNPYFLRYFWSQSERFKGTRSWHSLGGILLSVTGAEALFADQARDNSAAELRCERRPGSLRPSTLAGPLRRARDRAELVPAGFPNATLYM